MIFFFFFHNSTPSSSSSSVSHINLIHQLSHSLISLSPSLWRSEKIYKYLAHSYPSFRDITNVAAASLWNLLWNGYNYRNAAGLKLEKRLMWWIHSEWKVGFDRWARLYIQSITKCEADLVTWCCSCDWRHPTAPPKSYNSQLHSSSSLSPCKESKQNIYIWKQQGTPKG